MWKTYTSKIYKFQDMKSTSIQYEDIHTWIPQWHKMQKPHVRASFEMIVVKLISTTKPPQFQKPNDPKCLLWFGNTRHLRIELPDTQNYAKELRKFQKKIWNFHTVIPIISPGKETSLTCSVYFVKIQAIKKICHICFSTCGYSFQQQTPLVGQIIQNVIELIVKAYQMIKDRG